jgi:beta-glucosidase
MKLALVVILILNLKPSLLFSDTIEDRINTLISQMTLQEKIEQLHKEGGFNTSDNTRLGIPGFIMADGPHGVRDGFATCFPVGIAMAATWDVKLVNKIGRAMGKEFRGKGKHQALGPCMDLCRDPRNGRSPESGGEDPFLCAQITTALVKGIQSTPCMATVKHFNCVNKQNNRHNNNVTITQRMLMEHYGLNFRSAVQKGGVFSVMNAYNLINGEKCAQNTNLLTTVLRDNWGFPFYVVSDWGSIWSSQAAITAGCDICMGSDHYENDLLNLVQGGIISESVIDGAVKRVLKTKLFAGVLDYYPPGNGSDVNSMEHQLLSLEAGRKCIVLLKNQDNILPLDRSVLDTITVLGPSANVAQLDGSGSSYVTPFYSVSPRAGIVNKVGPNKVFYTKGCDINSSDTSDFANSIDLAAMADVVIFFGGLDASQEGEGFDRVGGSVVLPGKQNDLINQLAAANSNIIVVLESGGICSVNNIIDNIKGLLYAFYPGQEGGNALADVLFGDYNPGGKLPVTMPKTDSQLPPWNDNFADDYGCGYRWFDKANLTPEFAFGYGLSYTSFTYSNLNISPISIPAGQIVEVNVDVTNTGTLEGEEVVQLYLTDDASSVTMPDKQLKGFDRISLAPGETKTVEFKITSDELYYFNETSNSFEVEPGTFAVKLGGSSDNLPLSGYFEVINSPPKPDFIVTHVRLVPPYPVEGDSVIFIAQVKNQGTGSSPEGVILNVGFSVNGNLYSRSTDFSKSIPAGGSALLSANIGVSGSNVWPAQVGDYLVEAWVDDQNIIPECIENNNKLMDSITVIPSPPQNIARNKDVLVSSIQEVGLEGENAVDGFYTTRWSSKFSDPQFIAVNLGDIFDIKKVVLNWEAAYGKRYLIQTSLDSLNWNTVAMETNGDGGIDTVPVSGTGRYIRMYGIERGTQWGYSLYEFEVYEVEDPVSNMKIDKSLDIRDERFNLKNNYPNPFNPNTTIEFTLPIASEVTLSIFNILGEEITTVVSERLSPGEYKYKWKADKLSSGVYLYQLKTEEFIKTKKMILMK